MRRLGFGKKSLLMACSAIAVAIVGVAATAAPSEKAPKASKQLTTAAVDITKQEAKKAANLKAKSELKSASERPLSVPKPPDDVMYGRLKAVMDGSSIDEMLALQADIEEMLADSEATPEWMAYQQQLGGLIEAQVLAKEANAAAQARLHQNDEIGGVAGGGETCASAVGLGPGPVSHPGSMTGQPADVGDGPNPSCGSLNNIDDWYIYTTACPGVGTATASLCASVGADTVLAIFSTCAGPEIDCDDDFCGYPPGLSQVSWAVSGGGSYVIRVSPWGSGAAIASYQLDITEVCPVCGNGVVEAPELCDDGNAISGDGCSSTCQEEGACCIKGMGPSCSCMNLTQAACTMVGGFYRGNASLCGMGLLGTCDCNGNNICDQNDQLPGGGMTKPYPIDNPDQLVLDNGTSPCPVGGCPAGSVCLDINGDGMTGPAPDRCGHALTFMVPDSGPMSDVNIDFEIIMGHTWYNDVVLAVAHGGVTVSLLNAAGGNSSDLTGMYVADDQAATSFDAAANAAGGGAAVIPPGSYKPDGLLSAFNGLDKNGLWTLMWADAAGGDFGTLASWSIHILNGALPPVGTDCNGNFILDACEGVNPNTGACCTFGACAQASMAACMGPGQTFFGNCTACGSVVCPGCGNGLLEMGEECDDGNVVNNDGCSSTCLLENDDCTGRTIIGNGSFPFNNTNATTDGVDEPTCAFTAGADDNIHNDLWYNYTATCTGFLQVTTCGPGMGGTFDTRLAIYNGCMCPPAGPPIDCDDDNDDPILPEPCAGGLESVLRVPVTMGMCYKIRVGEFTATTTSGPDQLNVSCIPSGVCGDGVVNIGEECDDGGLVNHDGCDSMCQYEGACCKIVGGICIDNRSATECASANGTYQGDQVLCADVTCPNCGNGTLEAPEECDDGGNVNGDGCDSNCLIEPAPNDNCIQRIPAFDGTPYNLVGATLDGSVPAPCDIDMTADVWFNYTATCTGFATIGTCDAVGTDTTIQVYNGCNCAALVDFVPVACADDNCGGGSGFSSQVIVPVVFNNCYKIRVGNWNGNEPVGALAIDCSMPVCGDSTVQPGEECDDGNLVAGDGCNSTCQLEGACCVGTACQQLSDTDCATAMGGYQGNGVACGSQCAFGACCQADGSCSLVSFKCCANEGGTFTGGTDCSPNPCPQPPIVNDDCVDRIPITDGVHSFSTVGATTDGPTHTTCTAATLAGQDIWYNYVATCNGTLTVSTCDTVDYDSAIVLYDGWDCGALEDPPLGCNDDFCGLTSTATAAVTMGQQVKIRIGGFSTSSGTGTVSISCGAGPGPCNVTCDAGKAPENEPGCGLPTDTTNGGCNSTPNVFTPIVCGQGYCGTGAYDGATRDTDWYQLVLASDTQITWSVTAEFDVAIGIVNTGGIPNCVLATALDPFAATGPCDTASVTACLPAGTWWLFVGVDFSISPIIPCGAEYTATVTCGPCPMGACCAAAACPGTCACSQQTASGCAAAGGVYHGDNTPCVAGPGGTCDCNANGMCDTCDLLPTGGLIKSEVYNPALAIPDCAGAVNAPVSNPQTFVSGCGPIVDLDVDLNISHTYIGDLVVDLTHVGSGTTVRLIQRIGDGGTNDVGPLCSDGTPGSFGNSTSGINVILDDEAASALEAQTGSVNPATPARYRPFASLDAFNGLEKCSGWTLTAQDRAAPDTGTVNQWSLHFVNVPQNPPVSQDCNGNGTPDECELSGNDCNSNGIPDDCELAGNDNVPPGGDGIPDDCNCINDVDCGPGMACDECAYTCMNAGLVCANESDCKLDGPNNACNHVTCTAVCTYSCIKYGDVKVPQNNIVNLDDILCTLSGFALFGACPDADIHPCGSNGVINLDDILAVLNAFAGGNPCMCNAGGVSPLCGSTQP